MESIFAMVIAAITFTLGVPGLTQTLETNRLSSQTNTLVGALRLARSEAVKRGASVSVCRVDEHSNACAIDAGGWESGWLVVTSEGTTLFEAPPLEGPRTLTGSSGLATSVAFNALGEPSAAGQFMLCEQRDRGGARAIDLSVIGRIRVTQHAANADACSAG